MESRHDPSDIAIIGMACVFPGASDMQQYWENILHKVNSISDAPPEWEAELFFEENTKADDRTYCKRGGFLGKLAQFDPFTFGIMPNAVDGAEPDHYMALQAAHDALKDCGPLDLEPVKARTAVIIGRGTYVNRGNAAALQQGVMVESILRILKQLHPEHTDAELAEIKTKLKASLAPFDSDTSAGLVPNIISGRIANRLDLMGPNYLIDAACASSLVAVEMAAREIRSGLCDLAIAGGVNANTSPVLMMIFSQLGALSHRGQLSSFDKDADGTLLGEGVGMVVMKRLAEAERDGNHIYAVLKEIGIASDGRATHVLAPRLEGEVTALKRAYDPQGIDPLTIGLLEAHGTGTPVGDVVEVEALRTVFPPRQTESPRCALGSVKSMISHTVPAAGSAGLIKAALALHHKVLPPTLCDNPNPKLQLEKSNFYINTETRPWIHGSTKTPRRAGVNAFGFGGINAHAILEEYTGPNQAPWLQHQWDSELFVFSGATRAEVLEDAQQALQLLNETGDKLNLKDLAWSLNCNRPMGPVRMTVVGASHTDLEAKLERAIKRLADERTRNIKEIEGIYCFREPLGHKGKLAFLFPGEGSQYRNMLGDLCIHFPEVRRTFDLMDRAYENHHRDYLPSDVIFPPPFGSPSQDRLYNMDSGAETVFCANQAIYALIKNLGIKPDAMVGHSTGEHSALLASHVVEVADDDELIRHILGVYEVFDRLNTNSDIPEAVLLAVAGADHAFLEDQVAKSDGALYIALDNCIHQVVLCGKESDIDRLVTALTPKGAICQKLPFARAYHTPWFEVFSKPLKNHFDRLRIGHAQTALYSCVTAGPYPDDAEAVRSLAAVQWSSTVRFRETIQAMYNDGVRLFMEVGPRGNLTGFTDDVLRAKPHAAIPSNVQHRTGIVQLHHMLGQLVAHGLNPNLAHLYARRSPRPVTEKLKPRRMLALKTGIQPASLPKDFKLPKKADPVPGTRNPEPAREAAPEPTTHNPPPTTAVSDPRTAMMQQHLSTMEQLIQTQQDVMAAYLAAAQGVAPVVPVAARPRFPFFHEIVEVVPGVRSVARHEFNADREILFHHHTLGRDVSIEDPSLLGFPMVPLTVTMEILAEGGALLEPNKLLIGMRDIRATRWIMLEKPGFTIEATGKQIAPGEVHVALRETGSPGVLRPILAEAVAVFGDRYPEPGPPRPFVLENEKASAWQPDQLYRTGMFHGEMMKGTKSIERAGRNGCSGTLEVLPHNALFAGDPQPQFLFDPVLLDAAGQVVAYWFWEAIEKGTDLFPYRVAAFHCYAPSPATGSLLECRVLRRFESDKVIHSDIEVLDRAGKVYYRLENWETRRFPQPPRFLRLRIDPQGTYIATPLKDLPALRGKRGVAACRVDDLPQEFLESSHGIWLKALAYLVLSRRERVTWESMQVSPKERYDWLLARCAAKDAVRMLVHESKGVQLCAADVDIGTDAAGRLTANGVWKQRLGVNPAIALAHNGIAAAVAAMDAAELAGVDLGVEVG